MHFRDGMIIGIIVGLLIGLGIVIFINPDDLWDQKLSTKYKYDYNKTAGKCFIRI